EGQVLARIAVVVDMDLVDRILLQVVVIRATVRVLQRQVVREQRHEAFAAGFVAAEHVEIGPVDTRHRGDERRLGMARGVDRRAQRQRRGGGRAGGERMTNECVHTRTPTVDSQRPRERARPAQVTGYASTSVPDAACTPDSSYCDATASGFMFGAYI